jgi:prepilin-type processing-associated H-X9-DG protein
MYLQDHEENFPAKETFWNDLKIDPGVVVCTSMYDVKKSNYGEFKNNYAYNTWVEKTSIGELMDPTTVFITCDSDNPYNLWYTPADAANRHSNQCIYSYADGHVGTCKDLKMISYNIHVEGYDLTDEYRNYPRPLVKKYINFSDHDSTINNFDFTSSDLNFGNSSPWPDKLTDNYKIIWEGSIKVPATGIYKFDSKADDKVILDIADCRTYKTITVLNSVHKGSAYGKIKLTANKYYTFKLKFIESTGTASMALRWIPPNGKRSRIPSSIFYKMIDGITSN